MHEQPSLFDDSPAPGRPKRQPRSLPGARQARDQAMAQIEENTNPAWRNAAEQAIYRTAVARAYFLIDDVWAEFERVDGDFAYDGVHDKRAMGPILTYAHKTARWIEPSPVHRPSAIVGNHGNPRTVWKSRLYPPPEAENPTERPSEPPSEPV